MIVKISKFFELWKLKIVDFTIKTVILIVVNNNIQTGFSLYLRFGLYLIANL